MDGSFDSAFIEQSYRNRLYEIAEDIPFARETFKRIKIIVLDNEVKFVVKYKVFEDFFKSLKLAETYDIPDIVFDENYF